MSITRVSEWEIFMNIFHYICSFPISLKWYQNKRLQKQNYTVDVQTIFYVKNPQGDLQKLAWYKVSENEHCWFKYLISLVAYSCLTLWDPMDCSMPGFPVHHQHWQFAQTQVHQAGDAIQPSHPLSSPSPPAFNLAQHWGLFKWGSSSHQVAKVLESQHQQQSFRFWIFRTDFL